MPGGDTGGGQEEVLRLAGQRQDAATARAFVRRVVSPLGWPERVDDACLLVSELVANVALHAGTPCMVTIAVDGRGLLVTVTDQSPVLPRLMTYSEQTTTGRGLNLVQRLADEWGTAPQANGKSVWFRLRGDSGPGGGAFRTGASGPNFGFGAAA